jgi:hypothetical protein
MPHAPGALTSRPSPRNWYPWNCQEPGLAMISWFPPTVPASRKPVPRCPATSMGVQVGCHAADRSEGPVELRGDLRWHDVNLEELGDQLEGMSGVPLLRPGNGSLGEQGDEGVRCPREAIQGGVADSRLHDRPPSGVPLRVNWPHPWADLQLSVLVGRSSGVIGGSPALGNHRARGVVRGGNDGVAPVNPLAWADLRTRQCGRGRPACQHLRRPGFVPHRRGDLGFLA